MPSILNRLAPAIFSYEDSDSFVSRLRLRRLALLRAPLEELYETLNRTVRILDVGGGYMFWRQSGFLDPQRFNITLLNLTAPNLPEDARGFNSISGDACNLTVEPGAYDLVFSNSVIEHVGGQEQQSMMAREVQRVCDRYIVQTPNFWFPFEPHAQLPLYQFLPHHVRALVILCVDMDWFPRQSRYTDAVKVSKSVRLLTARKMQALFPEARILKESFMGLTKSLTAVHGLRPPDPGDSRT